MERLIELYRVSSSVAAVAVLVAVNLVPLAGVLFWGWNLGTILVLYWVENGIVGVLNVPKLLLARGPARTDESASGMRLEIGGSSRTMSSIGRLALVPFFVVHYGLFWLVHGVFVFVIAFGLLDEGFGAAGGSAGGPEWELVGLGAVGLFVSHVVSFGWNFLGRGEFRVISPGEQMFAPYGRVVVLHLAILFGAFAVMLLGVSAGPIAVLVAVKTLIDVGAHLGERHRAEARTVLVA